MFVGLAFADKDPRRSLHVDEVATPQLGPGEALVGVMASAGMKQGDIVLVWGATGGLGSYATQLVLNGGGVPICVVSCTSTTTDISG
jgi:crotonyl-CoA reductase